LRDRRSSILLQQAIATGAGQRRETADDARVASRHILDIVTSSAG
jgi:hypothetical protein